MNLKGCGRKQSLRYCRDNVGYCNICLEGLRKASKNFSQERRSPLRGRKVEFPEYEGVVLRSVGDGGNHVDSGQRQSEGVMELYISGTHRD